MSRIAAVLLVVGVLSVASSTRGEQYVNAYHPFRGPVAYADSATKTIFYVETDGRHLSAISLEGKVLWTRDPFVDAHLEPYRVDSPKIIRIFKPLPWMLGSRPDPKRHFVAIGFNSTQTGVVDTGTGEFFFVGQD
jgi:hypothetical protein